MRRLRDLPLGDKLVVVGVAASALALIVSSAIFLFSTYVALVDAVRSDVHLQAELMSENIAASLVFEQPEPAIEMLSALRLSPTIDLACLYREDQQEQKIKLFAHYAAATTGATCPPTPPDEPDRRAIAALTHPSFRGQARGVFYMRGNLNGMWGRMLDQSAAAFAGVGLGVFMAVLLARRMQRIITEPIGELATTAGRITRAGDYSLRAARHGDDEIGRLVDAFNAMLSEIERRDEQLRTANRSKDEFLAALSHELRTPLNAVLGWIQVLRTTRADAATTERAFASIERNARAQASLIEDLLDISRIVSGKLHLKTQAVDLVTVIEAALEVVRPAAEAKGVLIGRHLPAEPQLTQGDPHRLQQIVWNLLSNAVKFTPAGGHVEVTLRATPPTHVIDIRDSGIGIAPDFLPHVFDRFRQADGSITRRHGGLGLGLAIARELTELHNGRIEAESAGADRGATFRVVLPQPVSVVGAAPPPATNRVARLEGRAVLVIDDDRDTRELATTVLSAAGASVETAASADEALQVLGGRRFDILLCDLAMPGIDGFELMQLIRQNTHRPHSRTPAVAVSAHAGAVIETRARQSGFDGFVAKPYSVDALLGAIHQVLGDRVPETA